MFYTFLYPKGKSVISRALPFTLVQLGTEMGILSGLFFLHHSGVVNGTSFAEVD